MLTAFRTGYPFDVDHWEDLTSIAMPEVSLGTPPTVIQTFPATFGLSTSLAGDPYDAIAVNSWLVIDPATKNVLFDGTAARVDVGEWEIVLSADQTTALTEGSWTLRTIVVGAAAAAPIISDLSFSVQSLRTALLTEMTNLLDTELGEFADEIQDITNRADDAVSAANSATSLVYIVLGVAVVGIVVAIVGIIVVLMRMPKRPT